MKVFPLTTMKTISIHKIMRTKLTAFVLKSMGTHQFSHFVHEMKFTLLSAPSSLDPQSFNPLDMVLKEHFELGLQLVGTSLGHCQSFDQQSSYHYLNGSIFSMKVSTCVFVCTCMSCEFFFFLTFLRACSLMLLQTSVILVVDTWTKHLT